MTKGYPSYHSRNDEQSIPYPQRFKVNGSRIYLPKAGWVRAVFRRSMAAEMKTVTVTKTRSGQYFVSIQDDVKRPASEFGRRPMVGVDVGLRRLATSSKALPDDRAVIEHA